jgi:hypothetical protein
MQVEDRIAIPSHFGGIGLAMKHPQRASGALRGLNREPASHEGKQIRRQRRRFRERRGDRSRRRRPRDLRAVSDRLPSLGSD